MRVRIDLDDDGAITPGPRLLARTSVSFLLFGAAYMVLISWLDPALTWPMSLSSIWLALLNAVPVLILNSLLLIVTRRVVLSSWLTLLALVALYAINHLKLQELATPLLPDDFHFLTALGVNYSFFSNYLAGAQIQLLVALLLVAVTLLLSREPVLPSLRGMRRGLAAAGAIVLAISLLQGSLPWTRIYNAGNLQFEPWAPSDSAARTGVITNMLLFHWELRDARTQPPDLSAAERTVRESTLTAHNDSRSAPGPIADEDLPDIIIVQSESLFDPARLSGVHHVALPRFRDLAQRGWSGDLDVPTFGGGTIRTEFEVLTGLPLAAFPRVRYPYLQLTNGEIPGLARELRQHGYRTLAIHPNGGAFWNRNQAFRSLGFDRFIDGDAFSAATRHGWYVADAALTDRIIEALADDGPPHFIMAISIQNHGPYTGPASLPANAGEGTLPDTVTGEARETLLTYIAMLKATDEQLARLAGFVDARERRTLLFFYSDHLPPLNAAFEQLSFGDGRPAREQPVPWLLLDNRSREHRTQRIASWRVPALLLERAGLPRGRYFDALEQLRDEETSTERIGANSTVAALAQLQYWNALDSVFDAPADQSPAFD